MSEDITFEDAKIVSPNFAGRQNYLNPLGFKSFAMQLDEKTGKRLRSEGWLVQYVEGLPRVNVAVFYDRLPPKVTMIDSGGVTELTESAIDLLDLVEIEYADLAVYPYKWEVGTRSGIKPYLKSLTIIVRETKKD